VTRRRSAVLRLALGIAILLPAVAGLPTRSATAGTAVTTKPSITRGADISWPNCPKGEGIPSRRSKGEPLPKPTARFVVVGVTNGPGFHPNPCLPSQLHWVAQHHLLLGAYALTTYPTARQIRRHSSGPYLGTSGDRALRNAGYAEARYNLRTMARDHFVAPLIWVDVEPYPVAPWSRSHRANRAVIQGVIRGYRDAGLAVGIYTYANGWRDVVGSWRISSLPTWSTVGPRGEANALAMCTRGPSGGPTWIAQWWNNPRRDLDVLCPTAPFAASQIFSGAHIDKLTRP
jgi:hypothetical protein